MRLNKGYLLIECLIAVIICGLIVNIVVQINHLYVIEKDIEESYEKRI